MADNQLQKTFWLTLIVVTTLLLLSVFPAITIVNFKLRKVNLLADIQQKKPTQTVITKKDTASQKIVERARPGHCPPGVTCIEDYSDDHSAMAAFSRSLDRAKAKPVRIAFFGDSFIEGDILTSSLRDTLQSIYGGRGVGYVPIATQTSQFRNTIQHTCENWTAYSFIEPANPYAPLCSPGYCFVPREENNVYYKAGKKRFVNQFHLVRMFYSSVMPDTAHITLDDTVTKVMALPPNDTLQQLSLDALGARTLGVKFKPHDSLKVYGLSFESNEGIYVDNFAMRGNSGMGLARVSQKMHRRFNHFRKYSLIVLQYGLNVVTEQDSTGYAWYTRQMIRVINQLKESYPGASILLVSVSDRSSNQDGTFATIPSIPLMRDAQREAARKTKVAFWDLYEAMGGANSMVKFVESRPPLAAKDYTHLTFAGGKKIAKLLAQALLNTRTEKDKQKNAPL